MIENKEKKIYCLFSVANDYNQPGFNLVCWWSKKPSFNDLNMISNSPVVRGKLLRGEEVGVGNVAYSLVEVVEAEILDEE